MRRGNTTFVEMENGMSKVRIAFFLDVMEEDFDGVSITMHQVIKRIPDDDFDPIFITPQPPREELKYPVYKCSSIKFPEKDKEYRLALPWGMGNIKQALDDFKPHIIHFSSPTFLGSYAVKYARKHHIPVTTIYHTHYPSFANYYTQSIPIVGSLIGMGMHGLLRQIFKLYKKTSHVFAPTESMKKYLLGIGVDEDNLSIWGRGVDTNQFNPDRRSVNLWKSVPKGNKIVLFVSRLVREKEPETLLRLYKVLDKERPDISLVLVGDGPTREYLEEAMPKAIFTGKLTGYDLAEAYASADVFVFPSTTETFGNVVLEALASGLPVVAAAKGGPVDIVKDGVTGALVEPQNEMEFYKAIIKLTDDHAFYEKSRCAALEYARSQNWESLCNELFDEYRGLTKNLIAPN